MHAGETHWYLSDHLGTVRDVVSYDDLLDDVVSEGHIEYDSVGNIVDGLAAATAAAAQYAFTGREWDADSVLYYYRARWYHPLLGRFASQDPIGFTAGDANLSRYVGNAVTRFTDPFGLEKKNPHPSLREAEERYYAMIKEAQKKYGSFDCRVWIPTEQDIEEDRKHREFERRERIGPLGQISRRYASRYDEARRRPKSRRSQ